MKETIEALNSIAAAIKGGIPSWVTAIEAFTPIVLTVITIILSVRMDKQNKKLQRELHNRDVSSQARHDILEIYDAFCQTLFVLKKRGPVAAIFANLNETSIWIQELSDTSIKAYAAYNRSKLLIDDKGLTEYLHLLTDKYDEIYTAISEYIYSGVPFQIIQNAFNSLHIPQNNTGVFSPLLTDISLKNQFIQMCDNEITKNIQNKITEYAGLLSDDAFDVRLKKYLAIKEFLSEGND